MPRRRKRFVMLDSTDILEQTSALTGDEFRCWVLLQAWANENGFDSDGNLQIARSRLLAVAPNRRDSLVTASHVVASVTAKVDFALGSRHPRVEKVVESDGKTTLYLEKHEENQGSEVVTKKRKGDKKNTGEPLVPLSTPPSSVSRPADDAETRSREKKPTPTERARDVWPRLVKAAARYGARWMPTPSKQATKLIAARIREGLSDDQLEAVIHGAMKAWGPASGEWDPVVHLKATTIYQPTKYEGHLEAYQARSQSQSLDDEVKVLRAKMRAARERERAAEGAQA